MEWLKEISSYCGAIVTIVGLIVLIVKPIRVWFVSWIGKTSHRDELTSKIDHLTLMAEEQSRSIENVQTELDKQSKAQLSTMRNTILHIFYQYKDSDTIPAMQYQSVEDLYESYHNLGGNGTATHIVEEIRKKTVV